MAAAAAIASTVMLVPSAPASAQSIRLEGRCDYAVDVANIPPNTGLALCRSASVIWNGANSSITYYDYRDRVEVRFFGELDGDKMTVERLQVRDERVREAEQGECTIYRHRNNSRAGQIEVIYCIAVGDNVTWAANFKTRGL